MYPFLLYLTSIWRSELMSGLFIKTLHKIAEFYDFIELQKIVWRLKDYEDCVPSHMLMAVSESGGLILGCYSDDQLVGCAMIIPAYSQIDGFYHHSHILGVHPDWQHKGVGLEIKKGHYTRAQALGVKKVTWTFDPLLGPNANLNIAKIGGIARQYRVDVYGDLMGGSELVSGIPSDRFWLEWLISENRVIERMKDLEKPESVQPEQDLEPVNKVSADENNLQKMESYILVSDKDRVVVEIPSDYQKIYDTDKDLAMDWRLKSRDMFREYFKEGFIIVDFYKVSKENTWQNYYLLEKGTEK